MSHPDQYKTHETATDREHQREILRAFCNLMKCSFRMTSTYDEIDAELFTLDKERIGFAEAKYRYNHKTRYPDYTIDASKIHDLLCAAKRTSLRAVLLVSWLGDMWYLPMTKTARSWDGRSKLFPVTIQKRGDRDEFADRKYHIPLSLFKKIV